MFRSLATLGGFVWLVGLLAAFALPIHAADDNDSGAQATDIAADADLASMDLEDLMSLEITSVSRRAQRLEDSAAAVFVITQEDIRRIGATSVPEALRIVPGLFVAQLTGNRWVVTSRGFAEEFANKLLVMIDGRTVYTPLFSGVYWDVQDVMLEDVDRIEVIRGPGASIWGANAVNGVINIITKRAEDTQGALVAAAAGDFDRVNTSVRWGGAIGDDVHYRAYVKYFDRHSFPSEGPGDGGDDWRVGRTGFRVDWDITDGDDLTVQGDYYDGDVAWRISPVMDLAPFKTIATRDSIAVNGWNVLGRFTHQFSDTNDLSVQAYFDRTERPLSIFDETRLTTDVDVKHHFEVGRHNIVWGFGYRWTRDKIDDSVTIGIDPLARVDQLWSGFAQDEIELIDRTLWLTLGTKLERNDYTGFEYQPTGRLLYRPYEDHTFWAAISRGVRTPARVEEDVRFPFMATNETFRDTFNLTVPTGLPAPFPATVPVTTSVAFPFSSVPFLTGQDAFESEKLLAYELGYRFSPASQFSLDVAAFFNDYDDVRSVEPGVPDTSAIEAFVPGAVAASLTGAPTPMMTVPGATTMVLFDNELAAQSYGVEVAAHYQPLTWWNLSLSYSWLRVDGTQSGRSTDTTSIDSLRHSTPRQIASLRSYMDLPHGFEIDATLYYTSQILSGGVGSHIRGDLRLGWKACDNVRLSLVGQNLFEQQHGEFEDSLFGPRSKVPRSFYGKVEWSF